MQVYDYILLLTDINKYDEAHTIPVFVSESRDVIENALYDTIHRAQDRGLKCTLGASGGSITYTDGMDYYEIRKVQRI